MSAVPFSRGSAAASPLHSASVHVSRLSHSPNPVPVGLSRGGAKKEEGEEIFGETVLSPKRLVSVCSGSCSEWQFGLSPERADRRG